MGEVSPERIEEIAAGFGNLVHQCLASLSIDKFSRSTAPSMTSASTQDPIYLTEKDSSAFVACVNLQVAPGSLHSRQASNARFSTALTAEVGRRLQCLGKTFTITFGALRHSSDDHIINISVTCPNSAETNALYAALCSCGCITEAAIGHNVSVVSYHATRQDHDLSVSRVEDGERSILVAGNAVNVSVDMSNVLERSMLETSAESAWSPARAPAPSTPPRPGITRNTKPTGWHKWYCCCCPGMFSTKKSSSATLPPSPKKALLPK